MPELTLVEAAGGRGELEWPEEVAGLLEVGANSVDLVNEVLNADDAELAKSLLATTRKTSAVHRVKSTE